MMTEDLISKYVFENQLVSVMNNTKWKELISGITCDPNFDPPVKIKYILDDKETGFSPVWWDDIERDGFKLIEWMEIKPFKEISFGKLVDEKQVDFSQFIQEVLVKHNIPFQLKGQFFLIEGYIRTSKKGA